jgi:anaerobic magnesium-protoporphyrin IX monomethyl ester cyclase
MKVLLVNPPKYNGIGFVREGRCAERESAFSYSLPPHSLMSIATLLKKECFEPKIMDCMIDDMNFGTLERHVERVKPDLIIINTAISTIYGDLKVAETAKKNGIFSALIGTFPTIMDEWCLKNSDADAVIRNEPEITSLELAKSLSRNKGLKDVEGLTLKEGGAIIKNDPRPFEKNMDIFRVDTRDIVNNRAYKMPFSSKPVAMVAPSRGCPFNCTFCVSRIYYGRKLRTRSPESIAEELREVRDDYGIRDIALWAEGFLLDKKCSNALMEMLKKEKIDVNLYITSRVDAVDYDFMKKMKAVGFRSIAFGVESGCQKILDRARKGITPKQSMDAIRAAKKANLQTMCHMIFGLPGETNETMRKSLAFASRTDADFYNFYTAIPYPGTAFYEEASRKKWIKTYRWDQYEINKAVVGYANLTREDIEKFRQQAFVKYYTRPKKIFNTLGKIPKRDYIKFFSSVPSFIADWIFHQ